MDARLQRRVQRYGWDKAAAYYERFWARQLEPQRPLFFQLGTGETLALNLEAAGFEGITVERLSTTLAYESGADACGAAFAGGPMALAYDRFDEPTREEAHAEYLTSIAPYRRGAGYHVPGEFVVGIAHR